MAMETERTFCMNIGFFSKKRVLFYMDSENIFASGGQLSGGCIIHKPQTLTLE